MRVVFRVDSAAFMGAGHLMRCLTLAGELRERGAAVTFVSREHGGHLIAAIEQRGFAVSRLPAPARSATSGEENYAAWLGVTQEVDARETLECLASGRSDWLVVDHYGLDAQWESQLRSRTARLLVIDDLANRRHDCDALLDQNYFGPATPHRYESLIDVRCRSLLGPSYALLQPIYRMLRPLLTGRDGSVRRVLVFFGGSDVGGDTARVIEALSCKELEHLALDVVMSTTHSDYSLLRERLSARPGSALHSGLPSLAGLMARADLAIGGGGSTTWERACLGLPAIVATLADNQRGFSQALAAEGYQVLLGPSASVSSQAWREAILDALREPEQLAQRSRRALALTDGNGATRVCDHLFAPPSLTSVAAGAPFHRAARPLRVTVLSDASTWLNPYIEGLIVDWRQRGYEVQWMHEPTSLPHGDVCFILSCSRLVKADVRARHTHNLVVHASALPEGRGWSPMTWQILEGRQRFVVSLFEAADAVDAGRIHLQSSVELDGTELIEQWRALQARVTAELCNQWLDTYPAVLESAREQSGPATYYRRRGAADSRLDPAKTLAQQFDLLRTVDNDRYPAFFEFRGRVYRLRIDVEEEELPPGSS